MFNLVVRHKHGQGPLGCRQTFPNSLGKRWCRHAGPFTNHLQNGSVYPFIYPVIYPLIYPLMRGDWLIFLFIVR